MTLNIKTKILLNGVLSVVISIMLVTAIIFFLLWEQSEKRAQQEICHAAKVIRLHIREMESVMKETAIRISNNQEYANKANFIQENKGNKSLAEMLDGEKRELTISLYEVAMASRIPMLVLYNAAGKRMCAVSLESHQARLSYLSDHDEGHLWEAVVPPGVPPRTEQWQKKNRLRQTFLKHRLPLPETPNTSIEERDNCLRVTAVSPLRVSILNPDTLKLELVQNGLVQVSRRLDAPFIRSLSDMTDKEINLFLGINLNVGTLSSYTSLEKEYLLNHKTSQISESPQLAGQVSVVSERPDSSHMIDTKKIIYKERRVSEGNFFEGLVAVLIKDRVIGAFSVLLSQEETRKARQQIIRMLFFVAMISILIVTPLTWFLAIKEIIEREQMQKELARHRDHLEELVEERTAELASANEQLDQKNSDLNKTLEKVEEANREITESITYARTIQRSLLAPLETVKSCLPDSFFIWKPCEIVSGDIYHIDRFEDGVLISVIDCTGHGVPGAFMTMLVFSAIRRITRTEKCHDPAEILNRLNYIIKKTLQQDTEHALSNDGLDAAICFVQLSEKEQLVTNNASVIFAGAKLPLIYIQNEELKVIRGDRQSLGYKNSDLNFKFTNHRIPIEKGMSFYMYSDGFTDQLGGKKGLRFGNSRLKKLLKENVHLPFETQREILIHVFNEWLEHGEYERQDDVTVAGFGFPR
ncbi:SpoIIE family protein phosphatase [Desulfonema magnum]|nr:SpoIIE family protein phosphatase [Desulfonema magnum]